MRSFIPALFAQALVLALRVGAATAELPTLGEVVKVVDGDTAIVKADRKGYTVRLIGVDAPEAHPSARLDNNASLTKRDRETILALGKKSAEFAKQICEGRACRLEYDKANEKTGHCDAHGRLLVYLWVKDKQGKPLLVNAHLIAQGYARALTGFAFDKDYKDQFVRLQQEARVARRGLWAIGPDVPWPVLSEATIVGNRSSKKYHRPGCSAVAKMSPDNRVAFDTATDAKAAGYEPCKLCKP